MIFKSTHAGAGKKHATSCIAIVVLLILVVFLLQYILGHTYWMHGNWATAKRHALLVSRSPLTILSFHDSVSLSLCILILCCNISSSSLQTDIECMSRTNHMDQFRDINIYIGKNRLLTKNNVVVFGAI